MTYPLAHGGGAGGSRLEPVTPQTGVTGMFRCPLHGGSHGPSCIRLSRPCPRQALDALAIDIGLAHARLGLTPAAEHLYPGHPVRTGWEAGQVRFAERTRTATPEAQEWLALRLDAWKHGLSFEDQAVTPQLLRQLRTTHCPVTRSPLATPTGSAGAAVGDPVTRLCLDAGFAAGNLARLSAGVVQARGQLGWEAAWRRAHLKAVSAGPAPSGAGLSPAEWARLAVLLSFATPLEHTQAARLPLRVLPPPRVRVLNPVQGLQVVLTLQLLRSGYSRRLNDIAPLLPSDETRKAFKAFMFTLLAKRLAAGRPGPDLHATRRALEDAWAQPEVLRAWTQLSLRLNPAQCEQLLERMEARGLMDPACRHLPPEAATDGWALSTQGQVGRPLPEHEATALADPAALPARQPRSPRRAATLAGSTSQSWAGSHPSRASAEWH